MSLPSNSTLYSPLHNFEFYNIHKNAQTSVLNTFEHHNDKSKDRINWYDISKLPKDRKIICILRDVYDRAISSFLYILKWGKGQMNIRKLSNEAYNKIMCNEKLFESFYYYLKEIKMNGFFDNHSLPQITFLNNDLRDKYKKYLHCSDRDIKKITHFFKFNDINKEFKKYFNINLRKDNTNQYLDKYKNLLKKNIHYFKKDIEEIYKEDIILLNKYLI